MPSPRTKPSWTSLIAFVLIVLPVLYVLAYAPLVRWHGGAQIEFVDEGHLSWRLKHVPCDGRRIRFYKPVDWLIDHTPMRHPLLLWAEVWNVRGDFDLASDDRQTPVLPPDPATLPPER